MEKRDFIFICYPCSSNHFEPKVNRDAIFSIASNTFKQIKMLLLFTN